MVKVFYIIAARIFLRDPQFLVFSVSALAISFVVSFLLWHHATHELTSDSYQPDSERIVRTGFFFRWTDDQLAWEEVLLGINTPGLMKAIAHQYDEIEDFTRILYRSNFNSDLISDHGKQMIITLGDKSFPETKIVYADPNIFSFFSIPMVVGVQDDVLTTPNAIVVSRKTAMKYFGDVHTIGKRIMLNNTIPLTITGVFEDLPHNTHLDFDIVISNLRLEKKYDEKLGLSVGGPHSYFKLKKNVDAERFRQQVNAGSKELLHKAIYESPNRILELFFQPLAEIPFTFHRLDQHYPKSKYFLEVARNTTWIILIIGLVNYINLMVASHGLRLKELGVKKTSGASFSDFGGQFIFESAVVHCIALGLAFVIMLLIKIPVENLLEFYVPALSDLSLSGVMVTLGVFILSILITGLYPSLVFFKLNAGRLFRLARVYNTDSNLIKVLSVFQYAIAMVMLILAFTISHQLYFVMNEGQGIRKDNTAIVDLSLTGATENKIKVFTDRLNVASSVEAYTFCHSVPGDNAYTIAGLRRKMGDIPVVFESNGAVDSHFISFFNLGMVVGENFKVDSLQSDVVILSEGAVERLGFNNRSDAIGAIVFSDQNQPKKVVGIVRDYKLRPLLRSHDYLFYEGHTGVVLTHLDLKDVDKYPTKLAVRFNNYGEGMGEIRKIYESVFSGSSFVAYNIDSIINSQYYNYQMSRNQLVFFLFVTMLIALMGLYAMTSLKIASKTKEVGVRKVLGADLWDIVWFLLNKSVRQLGIAGLIAIPASYFMIQKYFEDFEEHIHISWYHFVIPLMVFLAISWFPVASIVVRAARENPVQALKYE